MSRDAKIQEAARAPYRAFVPAADTQIVDGPDLSYVLTPSEEGSYNEVRFAALAQEDADAVIDRVLEAYAAHGRALKWVIAPGSRPADLADRLRARGLVSWWARAMACDPALPVDVPAGVDVEIAGERSLDAFVRTMHEAWQTGSEASLFAHIARLRAHDGPAHHLFLARIRGEPAAAAAWCDLGTSAYLGGAAVLPTFRGRGAYRALVAARLAHARSLGHTLATTQAREETSAPILERLGLETLYRFEMLATAGAAPTGATR